MTRVLSLNHKEAQKAQDESVIFFYLDRFDVRTIVEIHGPSAWEMCYYPARAYDCLLKRLLRICEAKRASSVIVTVSSQLAQ
jgi:hypothetical protein